MRKNDVNLNQYDCHNKIKDDTFKDFYELLSASLPREEYRSFNDQKQLLNRENYKILLLEQDNMVNALLTVWELEDVRFIEHLAVSKRLRGKGIGGQILNAVKDMEHKTTVLEVDLPHLKNAERRISFYERCGFHLNEYHYKQVPLNEGDAPLELLLMTYPNSLDENEFHQMERALYEQVYGVAVD